MWFKCDIMYFEYQNIDYVDRIKTAVKWSHTRVYEHENI